MKSVNWWVDRKEAASLVVSAACLSLTPVAFAQVDYVCTAACNDSVWYCHNQCEANFPDKEGDASQLCAQQKQDCKDSVSAQATICNAGCASITDPDDKALCSYNCSTDAELGNIDCDTNALGCITDADARYACNEGCDQELIDCENGCQC